MPEQSVLIAGCGDLGSRLGIGLLQTGLKVYGLRRNINQLSPGIQGIQADLNDPDTLNSLPVCTILVYAVSASARDETSYRAAYCTGLMNLLSALEQPPEHLFFVSSTAVYHQNDGGWVDEKSPTKPESFAGRIMLEAEHIALNSGIPTTVLRLSGIYGPGRQYLINQVRQGISAPKIPVQFSNRIHRDDGADAIQHLISRSLAGYPLSRIYLISDDQPAPLSEVCDWLAAQLKVSLSHKQLRRGAGSKRCSNRALRATGYNFRYPGYQDGYSPLLNELTKAD
ncbi:MAG: SDR family oxidoreductase [Pontibacterium sp.]